MDYFFNILRKGLVLTLMVVFGFVFTYVPQYFNRVPHVQALCVGPCPTIEIPGPLLANTVKTTIESTIISINTGAAALAAGVSAAIDTTLLAKETLLDGIAFGIAKAIISSLIGSLIRWINSGFKGSPAFIQDIKRFLIDAADKAAGEFIRSLGGVGSFICSPFKLDIQIALSIKYQQARENDDPNECRLSDIVNNIEDFYNDTFSESSLEDFITITSSPEQYTPYGQILAAEATMRVRLANAKGQVLTEGNWGGGFLSGKICRAIEGSSGPKESCSISKPGQVIAGSLNKALGAGQDQLVAADEINELVAALIGQLANQAIIGAAGLLGLTPGTGFTSPGFDGGSFIEAAVRQSNNLAASSTAAGISISSDTLSAAKSVQEDTVSAANRAIPALISYKNDLTNPIDKREQAEAAYNDAVATRDKALGNIPKIDTVQNEFGALETEVDDITITPARKQEIIQRMSVLQNAFISIGAITRSELDSRIRSWVPPRA